MTVDPQAQCGVSLVAAREQVRVTRALEELPVHGGSAAV
jgi:hypothetical protein